MQEKQQPEHKQGPPWKVVKKTTTYDEAVAHRDKIMQSWSEPESNDMQIKIRRMNDPAGFAIKTRLNPEVVEERKKAKKSSKSKSKPKPKKKTSD